MLLFQRFFNTLPSYSVHSLTQAANWEMSFLSTKLCILERKFTWYDMLFSNPRNDKTIVFIVVYHCFGFAFSMVLHAFKMFIMFIILTTVLWLLHIKPHWSHGASPRHPGAWWSWMRWTEQKSCEGSQGPGWGSRDGDGSKTDLFLPKYADDSKWFPCLRGKKRQPRIVKKFRDR